MTESWLETLRIRASKLRTPTRPRKVTQVRVNDCALLVLANEDVGRMIRVLGHYEPEETAFLRGAIRPDDVGLDIGANTGYFTMLMAQAASRGAVHAFEPVPLNAALVRAGAELNGFVAVRVAACVVGDREGEVEFAESSDGAYSSMRDTGRKAVARTFKVPMVTVDGYMQLQNLARVDIVKADVEGAEALVVAGMAGLLRDAARRPRVVMLELYDGNLKPYGTSVDAVIATMRGHGYGAFVARDGGLVPRDDAAPGGYNVVFTTGG